MKPDTNGTIKRAILCLKLIADSPFKYTKKELAEILNVSLDTIKVYIENFREAGFLVKHSGFPNYKYAISLSFIYKNETEMKLDKKFLKTYAMKRLPERIFVSVYRNGRITFSQGIIFLIKTPQCVSFEVEESVLTITFSDNSDFKIQSKDQRGILTSYVQDSELSFFLYDFFEQDIDEVASFRLNATELKKNTFALKIA